MSKWRKPALPFSWRMVLRREPSTWLGFVVGALILDVAEDVIAESRWEVDAEWVLALAGLLVLYTAVHLGKKIGWLKATDR